MKTIKVVFVCMLLTASAHVMNAQFVDLQFHKEFGSFKANESTKIKRDAFRAKFEALGFDSLGIYYVNTIVRVSTDDKNTDASIQFLRTVKVFKKFKLQPIVGFQGATGATSQYCAGVHYPIIVGRVRFLPFIAYVYNKDQKGADFRFTSGISTLLLKKKILLFGFVNAYTKDKVKSVNETGELKYTKEIAFQANPQIWFRYNKSLAVGSEIGMDYVASRYQKFIVVPTAAFRWAF
jgi:hypothetical protein